MLLPRGLDIIVSLRFIDKLLRASQQNKSWLCIGLDPDPELMPKVSPLDFNKAIIQATADVVCAYKPNFAFYEALGLAGLTILQKTIELVPDNIPVIGDAKRGDIGHTAKAYARALFSTFGCDAATVNPYLGFDSVAPFLEYEKKGVFLLCRTSNPGAVDFQSIVSCDGVHLYEAVALKAREWNKRGNLGLVVGATYPEELKRIRELCPDMPLLIPGIGTQGGDLVLTLKYGTDVRGQNAIIAVSRQILYASPKKDFAEAARRVAVNLRQEIAQAISSLRT